MGAHARGEAQRYASELGWDVQGISCAGSDSDYDGYVSCTVALKDGNTHAVECASGWGATSGCRAAPLVKQNIRSYGNDDLGMGSNSRRRRP